MMSCENTNAILKCMATHYVLKVRLVSSFLYLICTIFGICQEPLHPSKIKADVGHAGRLVPLEPWKANISEKLENSFR